MRNAHVHPLMRDMLNGIYDTYARAHAPADPTECFEELRNEEIDEALLADLSIDPRSVIDDDEELALGRAIRKHYGT